MNEFRVRLVPCSHVTNGNVDVMTGLAKKVYPSENSDELRAQILGELKEGNDIFLAFSPGIDDPVGFVVGSKKKKLLGVIDSFAKGPSYYVHWLVSKDTECAVQLLEEVLKRASDLSCRSIFVLSLDANSNSFLENSGFRRQPDLSPRGDGGMLADIYYRT